MENATETQPVKDDLADKYLQYIDTLNGAKGTWDDFFNWAKVPENQRSNFLCGCIIEQAKMRKG